MATSSVMCSSSSTTRTRGFGRDESDTVGIVGARRAVLVGRRELQGSPEVPPSAGVDPASMAVDTPLMVTHAADSDVPAPTVEIVLPVYNEEDDLEASVRRLHAYLRTRFPLSWRVTIADNASTDRTWGIACRLVHELDGVQA